VERKLMVVPDVGTEEGGEVVESTDPVSLSDAAEEALANAATGPELKLTGEQTALVPACKMKFQGMAWDSLDEVPALKSRLFFLVEAVVVGHETKVMKDGDVRELAKGDVVSVRLCDKDGAPL
jgi:hypothetical protein